MITLISSTEKTPKYTNTKTKEVKAQLQCNKISRNTELKVPFKYERHEEKKSVLI